MRRFNSPQTARKHRATRIFVVYNDEPLCPESFLMPSTSDTSPPVRQYPVWFWCVWVVLVCLLTGLERQRWHDMQQNGWGLAGWLSFWDMETTLPWGLLLLLPLLVWAKKRHRRRPASRSSEPPNAAGRGRVAVFAAIVFLVSLICSWWVGSTPISVANVGTMSDTVESTVDRGGDHRATEIAFADLPPAYHDEYSYLLQARTFLNGRLSWPGMTVRPDLFHQFHVLNERRTISRYFPWTGLWIAPFEALGCPVYGHWFAGALAAAMFYLALGQAVRQSVAFAAGLLIAVSPGIAIFSNLLLAHHPTLLALSIFTWAFFRMMRNHELKFACVAGVGLTLAMLARPMTAAGYGLPFGIWLAVQLLRSPPSRRLAIGFAVPLVCGFAVLALLNFEATGSVRDSAYQTYTDTFTPRHRYGFNNAVGNAAGAGPPALRAYDNWATNLTPAVAASNVWERSKASLVWSLAIAPLLLGVLMMLPELFRSSDNNDAADTDGLASRTKLRLLAAAVISLHVVHVPYWFDGIMHWHYVFETAPLLLMLAAVGFGATSRILSPLIGRRTSMTWLAAFVAAGLIPGWFALPVFNDVSKVGAAVSELSFSRRQFAVFQRSVQHPAIPKPALILVDEAGSDPQLSYIINPPDLIAEVLVCRRPETDAEVDELRKAFPDRSLYGFDPSSRSFMPLP